MEQTFNLLGIHSNGVVLSHTEITKGLFSYVVMEAITEEDEKFIDNSAKYYGETHFVKKNGKIIKDADIYVYGEINLNDPNDINIIKHFNMKNEEINSNFVHSNFDFEKGCFTTKDGVAKTYPTSDALLWFKYNYVLLGKPKRIIVYRTTKTITR